MCANCTWGSNMGKLYSAVTVSSTPGLATTIGMVSMCGSGKSGSPRNVTKRRVRLLWRRPSPPKDAMADKDLDAKPSCATSCRNKRCWSRTATAHSACVCAAEFNPHAQSCTAFHACSESNWRSTFPPQSTVLDDAADAAAAAALRWWRPPLSLGESDHIVV